MNSYEIKEDVKKKDLIKFGFKKSFDNTYKYRHDIYKDAISVELTIWFEEDNMPWLSIRFVDNSSGATYPIYCDFGKSKVRQIAIRNYKSIMKRLVKKDIAIKKDR